jgi:predicted ester cyclase
MSLEENIAVVRRLAEAINEKDLTAHDDIMAPDFIDLDQKLRGLESFKKYKSMFLQGFLDMHLTIKDIIAKGDRVWIRSEITATYKGEFRGIPPTGNKITFKNFMIWRIINGKIAERESQVWDFIDFYKQLGIIKYTETGKKLFQQE